MKKHLLYVFLLCIGNSNLNAQSENPILKKLASYKIQPIVGFQVWGTYTIGQEVFNETTRAYDAVGDRFNVQIRRTRLGIKGQPYENLKFTFLSALDFVGRDLLSATQGGANNGAAPRFQLWNAHIQWRILKQKDALHMTLGYQAPQIGRESITGATASTSMEKSWSQNYLRRQLVGTGPGRAVGFNVGGLFYKASRAVSWSYDLGFFNPVYQQLGGNSTGNKYAPLLVGRFVTHFGDPESTTYTTSHSVNYFNKRKGLSIALSGAAQSETDLLESNQAVGLDFLFNWDKINFDGEWFWMRRKASPTIESKSNTGYLRMSFNINLPKQQFLEPVVMLTQFNGALSEEEQLHAGMTQAFAGKDHIWNIGFNYYLNPKFKLSLHYTFQDSDAGFLKEGATFNNYFFQGGVGAIRRGDWLGLGLAIGL